MATKERKAKPKLDPKALAEASVPEIIEAVQTYLVEKHGHLSEEDLVARVKDARARLADIEADLALSEEGLADALLKDEQALGESDLDAPVVAKHFQRERERLAKLVPQRWRLRKVVAELDLLHRMRVGARESERTEELARKIGPLEEQMRELEAELRRLQDERQGALYAAQGATGPMKQLAAQVVELQTPDLGGLARYVGLQ